MLIARQYTSILHPSIQRMDTNLAQYDIINDLVRGRSAEMDISKWRPLAFHISGIQHDKEVSLTDWSTPGVIMCLSK